MHSFPSPREQEISPLILIRTTTEFAWYPLESRPDLMAPLEFYSPEMSRQANFPVPAFSKRHSETPRFILHQSKSLGLGLIDKYRFGEFFLFLPELNLKHFRI